MKKTYSKESSRPTRLLPLYSERTPISHSVNPDFNTISETSSNSLFLNKAFP